MVIIIFVAIATMAISAFAELPKVELSPKVVKIGDEINVICTPNKWKSQLQNSPWSRDMLFWMRDCADVEGAYLTGMSQPLQRSIRARRVCCPAGWG